MVREVVRNLLAELDITLGLSGLPALSRECGISRRGLRRATVRSQESAAFGRRGAAPGGCGR